MKYIHILVLLLFITPSVIFAESTVGARRAVPLLAKTKGAFNFAVIGDNRSGDRVYKMIIDQMMKRKPLFVVNTGDIIPNPGNREQWAHFRELSKTINVPYFLTPGNHDIDDKESELVWRDEVDLPGNEEYYSFTVGDSLFVILNSCEPENEKKITDKQFDWLKKTLNSKKYEHKFIFLHHPLFLFQNSIHLNDSLDKYPEYRDKLHQLFLQTKVTAVFAGHEHTYRRTEKNGLAYIITGGAGAPLYGREAINHVMIINIDGGHVGAKVIDREGMMMDEFVIH